MSNLFNLFIEEVLKEKSDFSETDHIELNSLTKEDISRETRKVIDKIAIRIMYKCFENENLIHAVLNLSQSERIIIVFHLAFGMTSVETALLLDVNLNAFYTYKCRAIKKLKKSMYQDK